MATHDARRPRELALGETGRAVADNVRRLRLKAGLKISDLATQLDKAGRPTNTASLSRIETAARKVDVDDLMALAKVFGVSPLSLLLPNDLGPGDRVRFTGDQYGQRGPWDETDSPTARNFWAWAMCQRPLMMPKSEYPAGGPDRRRYLTNFMVDALPVWWPIEIKDDNPWLTQDDE